MGLTYRGIEPGDRMAQTQDGAGEVQIAIAAGAAEYFSHWVAPYICRIVEVVAIADKSPTSDDTNYLEGKVVNVGKDNTGTKDLNVPNQATVLTATAALTPRVMRTGIPWALGVTQNRRVLDGEVLEVRLSKVGAGALPGIAAAMNVRFCVRYEHDTGRDLPGAYE